MPACIHIQHVYAGGKKRGTECLGPEVSSAMIYHVGAGIESKPSTREARVLLNQ